MIEVLFFNLEGCQIDCMGFCLLTRSVAKAIVLTQELSGFRPLILGSTWCVMADGEKRALISKVGERK
jgi:hypothetical protein